MKTNAIQWPRNCRILEIFNIEHPIIQGGMVWISGANLVAAVSNTGCLGLLGAGSLPPDLLKEHIQKVKRKTSKPFGVNIPLLYEKTAQQIHIALDEGVRIFFTSAGSPKTWTPFLKKEGCRVVHVVSTPEFALKSQDAGVDAVVVEGFEAGGHNGRQELTTFVLLQQCQNLLSIPYIAAGGIASGNAILAALVLGAAGVQMGTAFAAAQESSAHDHFKNSICQASFHSTFLRFKKLLPVRLLDNPFSQKVAEAENLGATKEDLKKLLGKGRARLGMHLGDLEEGELEIGQIASEIKEIKTCADIVAGLQTEYLIAYEKLSSCSYHKEKNF